VLFQLSQLHVSSSAPSLRSSVQLTDRRS
jgi:hypothetical protein